MGFWDIINPILFGIGFYLLSWNAYILIFNKEIPEAHVIGLEISNLESNVKAGTLILSNKFKVGGAWEPEAVHDIKTLRPHQKTLYQYRA